MEYSLAFEIVFVCMIDMFCIVKTYQLLQKIKIHLSKHTYYMYRVLINLLVLEMLNAVILVFLPLSVSSFLFLIKWQYLPIFNTIVLMVLGFFPIVSHLITLIYVSPYRQAVKELLDKIVRKKKNMTKVVPLSSIKSSSRRRLTLPSIFITNAEDFELRGNMYASA